MSALLRVTVVTLLTCVTCLGLLVALDLHLHRKFDDQGALNYRGYRGAIVGDKQAGEHRIGVFGGSAAMGYGLPDDQSLAGQLRELAQTTRTRTSVVNLAATGEQGLQYFAENYELFKDLQLDTLVFLVHNEPVSCRIDPASIRDWPLFVGTLQQRHRVMAGYVADSTGLLDSAEVRTGSNDARQRILDALHAALASPDAVDTAGFADLHQRYAVDPMPFEERDALACLTNLLLLKSTLGRVFDPVRGFEQVAPSRRSANPVFRRFNYWFILVEVGWEKYYLVRYGDISKGYATDPWRGRITGVRAMASRPFEDERNRRSVAGSRATTLIDFVERLTSEGRRVYFLMYPFQRPDHQVPVRMSLDYRFGDREGVEVVDLSRALEGARDDYFMDGVHFNVRGNRAAAAEVFERMRVEGLAD